VCLQLVELVCNNLIILPVTSMPSFVRPATPSRAVPLKHRYLPYHAYYVDLDDDLFISEEECDAVRNAPGPELSVKHKQAGPGCTRADTDGDGRVSIEEYSVCCSYPKRTLQWSEAKQSQLRVPPPPGVAVSKPPLAQEAAARALLNREAIDAFLAKKA
jgi:hypothetical protein